MKTALALLLLPAFSEWAAVSFADLLDRARLVVVGEVVEIVKANAGPPVARLKIERVFKGRPEAETINLPFKTNHTWACDFTIEYQQGKKYLLLLDDRTNFRVVYYPSRTHDEIQSYDAEEVVFTRLACDAMAGVEPERCLPALIRKIECQEWRPYALDVFRYVPRAQARPFLDAVRDAHALSPAEQGMGQQPRNPARPRRPLPNVLDIEFTRDLSLVSDLLKVPRRDPEKLGRTLALLTGWTVTDLNAFEAAWSTALKRAGTRSEPAAADDYIALLGSENPVERDRAYRVILDLGPDVLEALKARQGSQDVELRTRILALIRDLELLKDLREDGEARARR